MIQTLSDQFEHLLARADGRRLVSVTTEVEIEDPSAAVAAARMAGDRWFCWEQPDRDGFAIAALGTAAEVVSRGADRFRDAATRCADVLRGRLADEPPDAPAGAGPLWVAGFAFAADGGSSPTWSSLAPALAVLPEVSLMRRGGRTLLTASVIAGEREADGAIERIAGRLAALRPVTMPLVDPDPLGAAEVASALRPDHYETAVERGVERIRRGELEKVVLAREVVVTAASAYDPAAIYGAMRDLFPSCFCFCFGTGEAAFIGASPELLVRREGASVATVALAGSTRRSADPAVDDHLGERLRQSSKDRSEHAIVARRIERTLRPHAIWVSSEPEPQLVQVANIQHLATPIHAQLAEPRSALDLAGLLHPTPAVGGEPREAALAAMGELEDLDRGWYAGAVGWMDASEDGEFCVALRSALLRDRYAHLFAGAGIVADSDPAAELAETELKLDALLPLLSG